MTFLMPIAAIAAMSTCTIVLVPGRCGTKRSAAVPKFGAWSGSISVQDAQHLRAANRFVQAGDLSAAWRELSRLSQTCRAAGAALEVRYGICASQVDWAQCRDIASLMLNLNQNPAKAASLLRDATEALRQPRRDDQKAQVG